MLATFRREIASKCVFTWAKVNTYIIGPVVQNSHIFWWNKGNTRRLCNFVDFARELRVATSMYSKGPNCIQAYMQSPRAFTTLILNNASGNPDPARKRREIEFQTPTYKEKISICAANLSTFRFSILWCQTSFDISSRPLQKLQNRE